MGFRTIEIPGVGEVDFPDTMSDEQVAQAIQRDILKPNTIAAAPAAPIDLSRRAPLPGEVTDEQAAAVRAAAPLQGRSPALAEAMTREQLMEVNPPPPSLEDYAATFQPGEARAREPFRPASREAAYRAQFDPVDPSVRGVGKGFAQAATAGTYQPEIDPQEARGAAVGAVGGALAGGALSGLAGPAGPAAFSYLSFLNELKRRGYPVERMTEPEIQAAAATSGLMASALPASAGGRLLQRVTSGAALGAGQNLIEEEAIAAITDTPAERLPAAVLGGAFGAGFGAVFKNSPRVQQAVKARLAPQQWEAIASRLQVQGPPRPEATDAEFTPVPGAPRGPEAESPAAERQDLRAPQPAGEPAAAPFPEGGARGAQQDAGHAPDEAVPGGAEQRQLTEARTAYFASASQAGLTADQMAAGWAAVEASVRRLHRGDFRHRGVDALEMRVAGEAPAPAAPRAPEPEAPAPIPPAPDAPPAGDIPEPPARPRLGLSLAKFQAARKHLTKYAGTRNEVKPTEKEVLAFLEQLGDQPIPEKKSRNVTPGAMSLVARGNRTREVHETWRLLENGGGEIGADMTPVRAADLGPKFEALGLEFRRVKTRDPAIIRYKDNKGKTYDFAPDQTVHTGGALELDADPAALRQEAPDPVDDGMDGWDTNTPLYQTAELAGVPTRYAEDEQVVRRARELWEAKRTDSPFFQKWFGASKVRDEAGKPKVVYHGTSRAGFDEFDTYGSQYGLFGTGSYFTESPDIASSYTSKTRRGEAPESPGVYATYLALKNPIDMDAPADLTAWRKAARDVDFEGVRTNEQAFRELEETVRAEGYSKWEGAEVMQDALRAMGHDGITHIGGARHGASDGTKHRVWIAFDPEQIKSATGNRGTFHEKDPNILFQRPQGQQDMFGKDDTAAEQTSLFGGPRRPAAAPAEPPPAAAPRAPEPPPAALVRPAAAPSRPAAPPKEATGIQDIGEKIGGARKDTATSTGRRAKMDDGGGDEPGWRRRFEVLQIMKSMTPGEAGRWAVYDLRTKDWKGHPRQVGRNTFATAEEAEAIIPLAAVALKHRVTWGKDASGADTYKIVRDVTDRKRVTIKDGFKTEAEAKAYMATHAQEIIETKTGYGEEILATPEKVFRKGAARRQGDVAGENFREAFGFRGVEFGKWNNQAERQEVMNHAYDALLDLADILKIPPKAIGLNGDLALAFGARGQGLQGAKAHYERDYGVINLTKLSGAGSLAHEWFHALDHYLGRLDSKASSERVANSRGNMVYSLKTAEGDMASHGFSPMRSKVRAELRAAYETLMDTMFRKAEKYVEDTQRAEKFVGGARDHLREQLKSIRDNLANTLEYKSRHNKPASAEQLAEFDALAARLESGEALDTKWLPNEKAQKGPFASLSGRYTNDVLEKISDILKEVRGRSGFTGEKTGPLDTVRYAMVRYAERIKMLKDANAGEEKVKKVPTSYAMAAKAMDQGRASEYWNTPHEMAARAFSAFVEDKVAAAGGRSDFLSFGADNSLYRKFNAQPFPEGAERQAINQAFDKFLGEVRTQETDKGTALYQRATPMMPAREGEVQKLFSDSVARWSDKGGFYTYLFGEPVAGGKTEADAVRETMMFYRENEEFRAQVDRHIVAAERATREWEESKGKSLPDEDFEPPAPDFLDQSAIPQDTKGSFHMEGRKAIITLFRGKADFSTWMHEHAHFLRRAALEGEDERTITKWLETQGIQVLDESGNWTRDAEERFARAFERYLRDGRAPNEGLKAAFAKIAKFMREVYQTIRGTELAGAIPENVRFVYDRLVTGGAAAPAEGRGGPATLFQEPAAAGLPKVGPEAAPAPKGDLEDFSEVISYDSEGGNQKSQFVTDSERLYTDYVNEAYPIEKIQTLFEKEQGRKVSPAESIKLAINRVLGSGGSANLHLQKHLKPIYQGGETPDGYMYPRLTPNEARLVDRYALARDTLWRLDNVEGFENPSMSREQALDVLRKHEAAPPVVRAKVEHAAQGLVRYAKDLARRKMEAGLPDWTPEKHEQITRNPHYIPQIRDFGKVTNRPVGKSKKNQFTSTNRMVRGTLAVDVNAPVFDPLSGLISDTHEFAAEAAKMAVWNKVIDLVEASPTLDKWIRRLPADYDPNPAEGQVPVLRNRQVHLTEGQQQVAEKYEAALETIKRADQYDRDDGTRRHQLEQFRTMVYRDKGKMRAASEEIEEAVRRLEANWKKGQEKKLAAAEKTVEEFKKLPKAERNLILDWIDEGKPQIYLVPKEIADAVAGMAPVEWKQWQKPMVAAASLFRKYQVGRNADFTLSNLPRDIQEAYFNVGMKPWYAFKGLVHYLKKDEVYESFLKHGGSMEGDESGMRSATDMGGEIRYGTDKLRNRYAKVRDAEAWKNYKTLKFGKEIDYGWLARRASAVRQTLNVPFHLFEAFGEAGEMMSRLGVMDMALNRKKLTPAEAADLARGATLDFRRIGKEMKSWNAMIPFLNARIQGLDRMVRTVKDDPAGAATRMFMSAAAPAALLLAWNQQNENYKDIPAREKQYYWILMTSTDGTGYLKLAKGHLAQLVVNPIQMMFENWLGTAKKDWWKIAADVLKSGMPVDDVGSLLNPGVKIPIELLSNYDFFFEREIVQDPNRPAAYQYNQSTAETLKAIGRGLGVSPAQMQHVAKSLLGGTATNILWFTDFVLGKTGALPDHPTKIDYTPYVKRLGGITQEWKGDLEERARVLRREIKAKREAYGVDAQGNLDPIRGSYAKQIRKAKDEGRGAEEKAQAKQELADLAKEIRELEEELKAVHKGMKANEQLRRDLKAKETAAP